MSEREEVAELLWQAEKDTCITTNYPERWTDEPLRSVYRDVADAVLASDWLVAHDERVRADERERLAGVEALAEQWNATPDYTPSEYDQGRVDQRHDMTMQLLERLAGEVEGG